MSEIVLPSSPKLYSVKDQDQIRRILMRGLDDTVQRLQALEGIVPVTPPPPPVQLGKPFGIPQGWASDGTPLTGVDAYTYWVGFVDSTDVLAWCQRAENQGKKLAPPLTGGGHARYINSSTGVFDIDYWKHGNPERKADGTLKFQHTGMDQYDTDAMRNALQGFYDRGVLLGESIMDEPAHPSWGPDGTLTKPIIDEMARYAKSILPGIPHGVATRHDWRKTIDPPFTDVDYVVSQYQTFRGDATAWRDGGLQLAADDGIKIIFDINIVDTNAPIGGACPTPATGGVVGTFGGRCSITPTQFDTWGRLFGAAGVAMETWQYMSDIWVTGPYKNEMKATAQGLADFMSAQPFSDWFRTP